MTGFGKVLGRRIPTGLMKQMNFSSTVLTWILVRSLLKKPNFYEHQLLKILFSTSKKKIKD